MLLVTGHSPSFTLFTFATENAKALNELDKIVGDKIQLLIKITKKRVKTENTDDYTEAVFYNIQALQGKL